VDTLIKDKIQACYQHSLFIYLFNNDFKKLLAVVGLQLVVPNFRGISQDDAEMYLYNINILPRQGFMRKDFKELH
jgi:hypothetical protein